MDLCQVSGNLGQVRENMGQVSDNLGQFGENLGRVSDNLGQVSENMCRVIDLSCQLLSDQASEYCRNQSSNQWNNSFLYSRFTYCKLICSFRSFVRITI